jgi:hypothetical protein
MSKFRPIWQHCACFKLRKPLPEERFFFRRRFFPEPEKRRKFSLPHFFFSFKNAEPAHHAKSQSKTLPADNASVYPDGPTKLGPMLLLFSKYFRRILA